MSHSESIVFTFRTFRETAYSFVDTIGVKILSSPGKDLVPVRLVAHIPNQLIIRCIENIMQCNCQLNNTQAGTKVAAFLGNNIDDELTEFFADLGKLFFF